MPCTIRLCSAASRAQYTWMPLDFALASNCSRYLSRWVSVCSLIAEASDRSSSHSGMPCISRSRFCRRSQSRSSCIFSCSGQQVHRLRKERLMQLGRPRMLEPAQGAAAVVQPDTMRKTGPGKPIDLLDVVQELDQLKGARPHLRHRGGLLDRVEIVAHVVDATARGRDDVIEAGEVAHEQRFGIGAFRIEPAIGHRLSATGLVARVDDLVAEPLQ